MEGKLIAAQLAAYVIARCLSLDSKLDALAAAVKRGLASSPFA
jgi:hypothetical protein